MWWLLLVLVLLFMERTIHALGTILDIDDKFFEFAE
jgi:hypothetical protein